MSTLANPRPTSPAAAASRTPPPAHLEDARSLFLGYYYSFPKLPEPMHARPADDRIGHFVMRRWDFSDDIKTLYDLGDPATGTFAVEQTYSDFRKGPAASIDAMTYLALKDLKVIDLDHKRHRVVLSQRQVLEEELNAKKQELLGTLQVGQIREGVVVRLAEFGAFVDLGGIDGLLHITDMSWGRVGHPSELFKVNDEIDVIVLKYDPATERALLGEEDA